MNPIITQNGDFPLATEPEQQPHVFAAAFNSGDVDLVERVYEHSAVLVAPAGTAVRASERRAANARLMSLGVPIALTPRHVYTVGDLALLVVDWVIAGTANSGDEVDIRGTATDVARRGPDGFWRYVIDNPFGTAG